MTHHPSLDAVKITIFELLGHCRTYTLCQVLFRHCYTKSVVSWQSVKPMPCKLPRNIWFIIPYIYGFGRLIIVMYTLLFQTHYKY